MNMLLKEKTERVKAESNGLDNNWHLDIWRIGPLTGHVYLSVLFNDDGIVNFGKVSQNESIHLGKLVCVQKFQDNSNGN